MIQQCTMCGSSKFKKENDYLICKYCGSNLKIDKPEERSNSTNKILLSLFSLLAVAVAILVMANNKKSVSQQEVSKDKQVQANRNDYGRFSPEPRIEVTNDNSVIDTQAIQVADKLQHLKVTNQDSTIQTQVIQTKNITKVQGKPSSHKKISDRKHEEDFMSNPKVVDHIEKFVDKDGMVHTTIYTKQPKIQFDNEHLTVSNDDIQIKKQNVSFSIDAQGIKHYNIKTVIDLE